MCHFNKFTIRDSEFYDFFHFLIAEIYQFTNQQNSEPPKMAEMAVLELLHSPKLISRKI